LQNVISRRGIIIVRFGNPALPIVYREHYQWLIDDGGKGKGGSGGHLPVHIGLD
jgi:hypothetical protein